MTRNPPDLALARKPKEILTRVSAISKAGVTLSYPHSRGVDISLKLSPEFVVQSGLEMADFTIGDEFKAAVVVRAASSPCETFLCDCSIDVVSIRRPIEPFNTAGMVFHTGIVTSTKSYGHDAVVACRQDGKTTHLKLTSATLCFQAQQDPAEKRNILDGLKVGQSVNLWVDPRRTDSVEFFSVNFV